MIPRTGRRMLLTSLLAVLAVPIGDAASAYWNGSGSGAGSGATGTTLAVTLSPGVPAAGLYPGGQANVALVVSNPNVSPVWVGSFALDTGLSPAGFVVDSGHSGCDVSALSFTTQTNGGAGWTVPAKVGAVDSTLTVTLTNALAMGVAAADACQGASYTVYLAAGP